MKTFKKGESVWVKKSSSSVKGGEVVSSKLGKVVVKMKDGTYETHNETDISTEIQHLIGGMKNRADESVNESFAVKNSSGKTVGVKFTESDANKLATELSKGGEKHKVVFVRSATVKEDLDEASVAMPLKGHPYHKKTEAELKYIIKDAGEAAMAMKGHNDAAEAKYLDQVNDAATVLHYRKRSGTSHLKESILESAIAIFRKSRLTK